MVTSSEKLPRLLGTVMLAGSFIGVLLGFVSLLVLHLMGEGSGAWLLTVQGWWSGDLPVLKFMVGLGILILGATPVMMLLVFGIRAVRERRYRTVLVAVGLVTILALGLLMDLLEQTF